MAGNANKARIVAVMGASGTGKSTWVYRQIEKQKRLMIWSPKEAIDDYAGRLGGMKCDSAQQLLDALTAAKRGPVRVVYQPPVNRKEAEKAFGFFCKIALAANNVCVLVEELHTVTRPSWAPDGWSNLILMGRGYGVQVYGVSQRPASVDKDFFSNCNLVHAGRVNYEDDAKVLSKSLMVDWQEMLNLPDMAYIERSAPKPAQRGVVKA